MSAAAQGAGPGIDAARVIADLRELERRTADDDGAQRLCWGPGWRTAFIVAACISATSAVMAAMWRKTVLVPVTT